MRMSTKKINNKLELLRTRIEKQSDIFKYGVNRLCLVGSFVRNEQSEKSDIDFLVEFEKGKKSYKNFIRLAFLLEEMTGRRVELITPESLSSYIRSHIMNEVEYVQFLN